MLYSHFFILDHLLSSFWTFYFGYLTFSAPHNGDRPPLAAHQQGLMELIEHLEEEYEIPGKVLHHQPLTGDARISGAHKVWREEKGFAGGVLFAGWLLKVSRFHDEQETIG
jgi:inositol phosphorylceramide synthase regulatory subunit